MSRRGKDKSKREHDLGGFEELSFQTYSYRPEYASYSDGRRPRRPPKSEWINSVVRTMNSSIAILFWQWYILGLCFAASKRRVNARDIVEILREKLAFLCGNVALVNSCYKLLRCSCQNTRIIINSLHTEQIEGFKAIVLEELSLLKV